MFGTDGSFQGRVATRHQLNAPWGLAMAPATGFGQFSGDLLVGNFGDGRINAFDPTTGKFQGQISNFSGTPIIINGLWGLAFGNGKGGTLTNGLYFTAGIQEEAHGLYGRLLIDPVYGISSIDSINMGKNTRDRLGIDSIVDLANMT